MASLILALVYILRMVISIVSNSRGQLMGNKIKFHMKNDLYKKMLNMPTAFFYRTSKGDMITRVTSDLEAASSLLHRGVEDLLFSLLSIAGSVFIMYRFNKTLSILTILPLPLIFYYVYHRNLQLKKGYARVRSSSSKLTSDIHDTLRTIVFVKDNLLEEYKTEKFYGKNKELLSAERENFLNISLLMGSIVFYGNLTQLIIIFAGGYLFINGNISMGVIVSFLLLTGRFRVYLMKLMGLVDIYQRGMAGIERFTDLMEIDTGDSNKGLIIKNIEKIILEGIGFSYEERKIFRDFTINIDKGDKIAFVGESGIGKSTILNLIKGSLVPDRGKVYINGVPLSEVDEDSYLRKIACVDQNDHIMSESIEENIRVAAGKDCTGEEFQRSIERAELKNIIADLPNREKTILGEGGVELSSGQKQRIALARMFLKDPEVILLDEATNTLDNITEQNIMENIHKHFKKV